MRAPVRPQRGLTLIELMISIAIGLVMVSALTYLFIGSRGTYRVNENVARLQETGRFALEWLSRDIRGAGYMGCLSALEGRPTVVARTFPQVIFPSMEASLVGYENGSGWPNPPPTIGGRRGDVVIVRGADTVGVNVVGANDVANANVRLADNSLGVREGDVLFISDCAQAFVIYVTGVSSGSSEVTISHAAGPQGSDRPGNGNNGIVSGTSSHRIAAFAADSQAKAFRFEEKTYFVGNNRGGRPALYRITTSGGTEEVVENVEDLEITYGEDTNGDGVTDVYRPANAVASWANVRSVRVSVLAVSPEDAVATQPQTVFFRDTNGDGQPDAQAATDRRLRQVFTTTIALRNRLS